MAATVTLVYSCSVGIQNPANFTAPVAAVDITTELPALAMNVSSDVTAVVAGKVRRTIVLNCTAKTNFYLPSNALIAAATQDLYSMKLALQVPCSVAASAPVVA